MNPARRPPGLLVLSLALAFAVLILALEAMVTYPAAAMSGVCLSLYAVPPEGGVGRRHYLALALLFFLCVVVTLYWERAWSDAGSSSAPSARPGPPAASAQQITPSSRATSLV